MIETLIGATWGLLIRIHANKLAKQRTFARKRYNFLLDYNYPIITCVYVELIIYS